MSPRAWSLAVCSLVVAALLGVTALAPLPVTIAVPGLTADVLGAKDGREVIVVSGVPTRATTGQLRMVTIAATEPNASVHASDVLRAWFRTDESALPHEAVYPSGSLRQVRSRNAAEMRESQDAATAAALRHLRLSPSKVRVSLTLGDVGGPSAGLMFTLGIIDEVAGDGRGGDLTGGRTIAGTGTITAAGAVGAVGGVQLKERAARRDGASVFLVPRQECSDAVAVTPAGLRVVPVTTLDSALAALRALASGGRVPRC